MSSIDAHPNDKKYLNKLNSIGTTFDEPPSFEKFLNSSLVLKPQAKTNNLPLTQIQYPNHIPWSEVLANAHSELNEMGGAFKKYT